MSAERHDAPIIRRESETVTEALLGEHDKLSVEWKALTDDVEHYRTSIIELLKTDPSDLSVDTIDEATQQLGRIHARQLAILNRQSSIEEQVLRVIRAPQS